MTNRNKTQTEDEYDVARDGETVTVRMHMMDGLQHAVAGSAAIFDATGHRPGYAQLSDADRERRDALYRDHDAKLSERWRTSPPTTSATAARQSTGDARLDAYSCYSVTLCEPEKYLTGLGTSSRLGR